MLESLGAVGPWVLVSLCCSDDDDVDDDDDAFFGVVERVFRIESKVAKRHWHAPF